MLSRVAVLYLSIYLSIYLYLSFSMHTYIYIYIYIYTCISYVISQGPWRRRTTSARRAPAATGLRRPISYICIYIHIYIYIYIHIYIYIYTYIHIIVTTMLYYTYRSLYYLYTWFITLDGFLRCHRPPQTNIHSKFESFRIHYTSII